MRFLSFFSGLPVLCKNFIIFIKGYRYRRHDLSDIIFISAGSLNRPVIIVSAAAADANSCKEKYDMKICYNETLARSTLADDIILCGKYGYDSIEIRIEYLQKYLEDHTVEDLKRLLSAKYPSPLEIQISPSLRKRRIAFHPAFGIPLYVIRLLPPKKDNPS